MADALIGPKIMARWLVRLYEAEYSDRIIIGTERGGYKGASTEMMKKRTF